MSTFFDTSIPGKFLIDFSENPVNFVRCSFQKINYSFLEAYDIYGYPFTPNNTDDFLNVHRESFLIYLFYKD